jgi:hypothetical protein
MSDPVIDFMRQNGIPLTRDNYVFIAYGAEPPDPWTPEHEAELPEVLQEHGPKPASYL